MRLLAFLGRAREDLRAFPDDARRHMGFQLDRIQREIDPDDWKSMAGIGTGVREIRYRDETGAFRFVYLVTFEEAIYVRHAFKKKTQRTAKRDRALSQQRPRAIEKRRP